MRIRDRALLISSLCAALAVLTIALQLASLASTDRERAALARQAEFSRLGRELVQAADILSTSARFYATFGEPRHLETYRRELEETRTRDRVLTELRYLGAPVQELALIEQSHANAEGLGRVEAEAIRWVDRGDLGRARGLLFDQSYDIARDKVMQPIQEFQRRMEARLAAEAAEAHGRSVLLAHAGFATVALTTLLSMAALSLYFGRQVVRPLARLAEAVNRIGVEDLALPVPKLARRDEIGDLARALETLRLGALEKRRLEAELEQARSLSATLGTLGEAVCLLETGGRIAAANKTFDLLFRPDGRQDATGIDALLEAARARGWRVEALRRTLAVGEGQAEIETGDGIWLEARLHRAAQSERQVLLVMDASERKRHQQALEAAQADARAAREELARVRRETPERVER
ncbi:MAG TPA: HAMP domain-containing protein [Azospirillaceae bacterium]|nr:HAMP domain-containing protein [Azospirillaceae bacterium]